MSQSVEDLQERAKFVASVLRGYKGKAEAELLERLPDGSYDNTFVEGMWRGWCMKAKDVQTNTANPA